MWGVATVEHGNASEQGNTSDTMKVSPVVEKDTTCHQINLEAKVNIPGVSSRSLQKYIASVPMTTTSEIQV